MKTFNEGSALSWHQGTSVGHMCDVIYVWPIVKLFILISDPVNCVRFNRRFHLLLLHHLRHSADDGGWAQVRPGPWGVHLCVAKPLPRHHQSVPISSADHWEFKKLNFCFPVWPGLCQIWSHFCFLYQYRCLQKKGDTYANGPKNTIHCNSSELMDNTPSI